MKKILSATSAFILTLVLFAAPVYAKNDVGGGGSNSGSSSGGGGTNDTNTQTTVTETTSSTSKTTETQPTKDATQKKQEIEVEKESSTDSKTTQKSELETETNQEIKDLLQKHDKHSDADRKKNCQAAENGLETKLQNLSKNATAYQTRIDSTLTLAINYQKDNNISLTNFDELVTAAKAAQLKAATSVSILNGLNPNLDCSLSTVSTNVAQFKIAAKQARTDLMAYKTSVKTLLQALEAAKGVN